MVDFKKTLGRRIRNLRKDLDYTQEKVAKSAGINGVYLSQVERGIKVPSVDALFRIARALKSSPGALIDGSKKSKQDAMTREISKILSKLKPKQRRAVLRAIRLLAGL